MLVSNLLPFKLIASCMHVPPFQIILHYHTFVSYSTQHSLIKTIQLHHCFVQMVNDIPLYQLYCMHILGTKLQI
jgi:hypothetical protein